MQSLWCCCLLAILLVAASGARAVQYDAGSPITMRVKVSAYTVMPGQPVNLTLSAADSDVLADANGVGRERVNDPVTLSWETTAGTLQVMSVTKNPVNLLWMGPMKPGYYAIFLTADDGGRYADEPPVCQIIELTVSDPLGKISPAVRVCATPQTITLNRGGSTTITAQLFNSDIAGKKISFYTTGGTLSADSAVTNATGTATVQLRVEEDDRGTITVAAFYSNTTSTTTVEVREGKPGPQPRPHRPDRPDPPVLPGRNPLGFILDVYPSTLPADGASTATVRLRLTDSRGIGIARQVVLFRTTLGRIMPYRAITDIYGIATVQLTAADAAGGGYITADAGNLRGYAPVIFTEIEDTLPRQPRIFLSVDPTEAAGDGAGEVHLEVLVLDNDDQAMINIPVTFSATLGTLRNTRVTTDNDGRAAVTLLAADRPGLAVVTAQVEQVTAASQVAFTGPTVAAVGLDVRGWNGQQTSFVADNWMRRQIQTEKGTQTASSQRLQILDSGGKVTKEYAISAFGMLIRDQFGAAHGFVTETDGKAQVTLLHPDGAIDRYLSITLPIGSHVTEARCAATSGHLLVAAAQPDGTQPQVLFFAPDNAALLTLREGLEALPLMALSGDGYLALALPGGSVRLYNPTGALVCEGRRTDGLPATGITLPDDGQWVAVAAAQTDRQPAISIFTRQGGAPFAVFRLAARALVPVSNRALAVSTETQTLLLNVESREIAWKLPGGFTHFLTAGELGVLARRDPAGVNAAQVSVVRLRDGQSLATQSFELGEITGMLPPDDAGNVGLLSTRYAFRIALPREK